MIWIRIVPMFNGIPFLESGDYSRIQVYPKILIYTYSLHLFWHFSIFRNNFTAFFTFGPKILRIAQLVILRGVFYTIWPFKKHYKVNSARTGRRGSPNLVLGLISASVNWIFFIFAFFHNYDFKSIILILVKNKINQK